MEAQSNSSSDKRMEHLLLSMMTSTPCSFFFFINTTILFILRSKHEFTQCPRYVLLFNLVLADTVLISQGQTLYLLARFKVRISYPLCGCLAMVSRLTYQISPLTLIFMSLERLIAVCFPFRHCTLVTLRNTVFAVLIIWTVASFPVLIQVLLLLEFPFHELPDLQMREFCSSTAMNLNPTSVVYDTMYTYVLFILTALIILGSFVGVSIIAFLATENKAQTEKTRYTLLLHLFQLGLNLLTLLYVEIFIAILRCCRNGRLLDVMYVCVVLMPRCLSALIYGLRDPVLRPALLTYLCCVVRLERHTFTKMLKSTHESNQQ